MLVFLSFTVYHYAVNLSRGQPGLYRYLCCTGMSKNDMNLHVFATKHKANTYYEHLIQSHDCVPI